MTNRDGRAHAGVIFQDPIVEKNQMCLLKLNAYFSPSVHLSYRLLLAELPGKPELAQLFLSGFTLIWIP